MSDAGSLFECPYSDRVLTQLQSEGHAWLVEGMPLSDLLGLVQTLGIDPREVIVSRGGARQIHLEVRRG